MDPETAESKKEEHAFPDLKQNTKIGIHAASNLIGRPTQFLMDMQQKAKPTNKVSRQQTEESKVSLTETEFKVLEGILSTLTSNNYYNMIAPANIDELIQNKEVSDEELKNIDRLSKLPKLRANKEQIYTWGGAKKTSIAAREKAFKGFKTLSEKKFVFCYERAIFDDKGVLVRDKSGSLQKEIVSFTDTLFRVAYLKTLNTKREYIEIFPSPVFLDQIDKYFILFPNNWRDEVKLASKKSRVPTAAYRLLFSLRLQYEFKRRSNSTFSIDWSLEKICQTLNIPKKYIKSKKKYLNDLLKDCYEIALACNYIDKYDMKELVHTLYLNENKYYNPNTSIKPLQKDAKSDLKNDAEKEFEIFNFYYSELSLVGIKKQLPKGHLKTQTIKNLSNLVSQYDSQVIKEVIHWSLNHQFWCSKVTSLNLLSKNFPDIFLEMKNKKRPENNLLIAKNLIKQLHKNKKYSIDISDTSIIFSYATQQKQISLNDTNFEDVLMKMIKGYEQIT